MKKTYNVKPIDEITINFADGFALTLRFDTLATYHLTTEFELADLIQNPSVSEMCAMILYSASVENTKDMTIEKARELVCEMDLETIMSIISDFSEATGIKKNEAMKDYQKKTMEQFVQNLCKKK